MTTGDATTQIKAAASLIRKARYLTAFTGAGISVESGIPPFRGAGGLWDRYDPRTLGSAKPNGAHEVLAAWERDGWPRGPGSSERGFLKCLITQNIDSV